MSSYFVRLVSVHGYWIVAAVVGLESMGVPAPGETILVTAAIYAGATHNVQILWVIAAAAFGGVVGDNLGFVIGRSVRHEWLVRRGSWLGITATRLRAGHVLFQRHGGKVVLFGRFVALLRALAAFVAGAAGMPWPRFLFFNALGAIVWATVFGAAAYAFGEEVERVSRPLAIVLMGAAIVGVAAAFRFVRRYEDNLSAEAERARL